MAVILTAAAGPVPSRQSLYDYRSTIRLQDEFLSGTTGFGTTGSLGWGNSNGTTTQQASIANRMGIIRRDTGAVSGTVATMSLYGSATAIDTSLPHDLLFIARLNSNDALTTVRIGVSSSVNSNPPAAGIYIEKLDADTTWFCVTRHGSVQTRTDSGIATTTAFDTFAYSRLAGVVNFYINGTLVCANTTNLTTTFSDPFVQIINGEAAAKTIDIDYFELVITGITR